MPKNPFKFLDSYDKEDVDRFFGRDRETGQLFNAVNASNLVLVYGASGTGKSSLINCGLANEFYDSDWLPIFIRRGKNLNESLRKELVHRLSRPGEPDELLRHTLRKVYLSQYRPVYLIFDQFEELYISGEVEEQDKFHATISDLLQAGLQCKMIFIIREEYIASLNEFEKVIPSLFDHRLRIELMNDQNLYEVIEGTAKYGNIRLPDSESTIALILDNLRDKREGVALTNLQVYMDRLWRVDLERQGGQADQIVFDEALVKKVGVLENVLSDFLDEQMDLVEQKLTSRGVANAAGLPLEILFTLVTDDGTKRNVDVAGIWEKLPKHRQLSQEDVEFCLTEFHHIRLLRELEDE